MIHRATIDAVNLVYSRILPSRKPEPIPDTCHDLLLTLVDLAFNISTNTGGSVSPSFLRSRGSLTSMDSSGSRLVSSSSFFRSLEQPCM
jgi:hypothetical protein